jgi:hypothetical protein
MLLIAPPCRSFFLTWLGLPYVAIHLVPVTILALTATAFWAWLLFYPVGYAR